jgi:mannosyltransferase
MTGKENTGEIQVIAPNLKRRLSGVTATIARLVPIQAKSIGIVATGPGLPKSLPHIGLWRLAFLPRRRVIVWHARRNVEMLLGLFLQRVLRLNLALVFTSASQRQHTGYTRNLIARMDAVIATSAKTASYLERPATVIHHGIDPQVFTPTAARASLRADLGLPDAVLVGCYGRIRHQKGTDVFVDAMISILADFPDAHGVVMGRATEAHNAFLQGLKDRVARAGLTDRFHFMPEVPVDQMAAWYQALDLFVAPQRWEGFGLTPLEAMACGVPSVATRVGAFEELIEDGKTGLLVARDDVEALAAATRRLLADDDFRATAARLGRKRCTSRFTLAIEAENIIAVYRRLLNEPVIAATPFWPGIGGILARLGFLADRRLRPDRLASRSVQPAPLIGDLAGKTVAIVGNARALADGTQGDAIDAADIVIRLNRAPRPSPASHGRRTDWLALATSLKRGQARDIKPARVLWMSHKRKRLPFWATAMPGFYLHPQSDWQRLGDDLGAPPSTGAMVIDLVARSQAARIDLYGFDFFSSLSLTGSRTAAQVPHDFGAEKEWVQRLLARDDRLNIN